MCSGRVVSLFVDMKASRLNVLQSCVVAAESTGVFGPWLPITDPLLLFLDQHFAVSFSLILTLRFLFHTRIAEALKPDCLGTLE